MSIRLEKARLISYLPSLVTIWLLYLDWGIHMRELTNEEVEVVAGGRPIKE